MLQKLSSEKWVNRTIVAPSIIIGKFEIKDIYNILSVRIVHQINDQKQIHLLLAFYRHPKLSGSKKDAMFYAPVDGSAKQFVVAGEENLTINGKFFLLKGNRYCAFSDVLIIPLETMPFFDKFFLL